MPALVWKPEYPAITVADFFREGQRSLQLSWEANEAFASHHRIREIAPNRPGLALAGFVKYFASRRIQVLGLAEITYLKSVSHAKCISLLAGLARAKSAVPAVVLTRGRRLPAYLRPFVESTRVPVLRTPMVTGEFITAATVLMERMTAPRIRVAGTMLEIKGVGVLLEGPPGIGKSEIALALIERGHSLVADDTTLLRRSGPDEITGEAIDITKSYMEIRGIGLISVPSLFGIGSLRENMHLDLIIHMQRPQDGDDLDRTGLDSKTRDVLGVKIPIITVPVAAGRDLTHVVEVAALNQRLRATGYDAATALDDRLMRRLAAPEPEIR